MVWNDVVRAVYPGRFQPVHLGHVEVIKWALSGVDELIIAIGTAQESHTIVNPFTAGERVVMLKLALEEYGLNLGRIYIIPVPDILMNSVWPIYVQLYVPRFKYGVARNPLVIRLFREAGYEVLVPPPYERGKYSSTKIRRLMAAGNESWRSYVPSSVAKFIDEIGGVERIREVLGSD
ncbi:MAG: nicotinamide-nucleotide adenylyltransferase [Sulfolobales archaeon]|nr:nicotinamide-nucleotide adenylyltransferase [Sulfolobales archaeon]MDW8083011.1 nicotinamide-nucleotide adenylyltransferase [Sulfolobales archaeon]